MNRFKSTFKCNPPLLYILISFNSNFPLSKIRTPLDIESALQLNYIYTHINVIYRQLLPKYHGIMCLFARWFSKAWSFFWKYSVRRTWYTTNHIWCHLRKSNSFLVDSNSDYRYVTICNIHSFILCFFFLLASVSIACWNDWIFCSWHNRIWRMCVANFIFFLYLCERRNSV